MNPNERTTGRMPEMLQDCDRRLSRALSNTPDARLHAREAAAAAAAGVKVPRLLTGKEAAALSVANMEEHGDNPFSEWKLMQAVQRKFCAVNGLPEPAHNPGVAPTAPAAWMHEFKDPHTGERRMEPRLNRPKDYELQPGDTVRPLAYADGVRASDDASSCPQSPLEQKEGPA